MIDYSEIDLAVWIEVIGFIIFLAFLASWSLGSKQEVKDYDLSRWNK